MPKGAETLATVYTMIEMTRTHELNIYKYLNYLLNNLPSTKMIDAAHSLKRWREIYFPARVFDASEDVKDFVTDKIFYLTV